MMKVYILLCELTRRERRAGRQRGPDPVSLQPVKLTPPSCILFHWAREKLIFLLLLLLSLGFFIFMYKISTTSPLKCKYCVSTLSYRVYKHFKIIKQSFVK